MSGLGQFRRSGDVGDGSAYHSIAAELMQCSKTTRRALAYIPVATENLVRPQMTTESANGAIIRDTHDWSGDLERLQ